MPQPILLIHRRSPGDIVCLTAVVRDLAASYPDRFEIHVGGSCPELWSHNPHIAGVWGAWPPHRWPTFHVSYREQIQVANQRRVHLIAALHQAVSHLLNLPIPVLRPRGDLHLSDEEQQSPLVSGRYWLLVAGGKADTRTKIWSLASAQALVHQLSDRSIRLVQIGAAGPGHEHHPLQDVHSLIGKTTLRDVLRLVDRADGVIGPPTFAMHVAAALNKPCVVIAGGREPWWWAAYVNAPASHFGDGCAPVPVPHRFLHTQGQLDCCQDGGCWKTQVSRTIELGPADCLQPVASDPHRPPEPACLAAITPEVVAEAALSYYRARLLPPLTTSEIDRHAKET